MARSDQWIGLTNLARKFVKTGIDSPENHGSVDPAFGISPFKTGAWVVGGTLYREVVQITPWSSGPMYFTCLVNPKGEKLFEWIQDREVRGEVDEERGRYWV